MCANAPLNMPAIVCKCGVWLDKERNNYRNMQGLMNGCGSNMIQLSV